MCKSEVLGELRRVVSHQRYSRMEESCNTASKKLKRCYKGEEYRIQNKNEYSILRDFFQGNNYEVCRY